MMFLVLLVLHDPEKLEEVLKTWDKAGVKGVTILSSTGLARQQTTNAEQEDLPLLPSLELLEDHLQRENRTIFSIVDSDEMVNRLVVATQMVTGDLNKPKTGILVVVPVLRAYGLNRKEED